MVSEQTSVLAELICYNNSIFKAGVLGTIVHSQPLVLLICMLFLIIIGDELSKLDPVCRMVQHGQERYEVNQH